MWWSLCSASDLFRLPLRTLTGVCAHVHSNPALGVLKVWQHVRFSRSKFQQLFNFTVPFTLTPSRTSTPPYLSKTRATSPSRIYNDVFQTTASMHSKRTYVNTHTHTLIGSTTACTDPDHWAESTFQLFITSPLQHTGGRPGEGLCELSSKQKQRWLLVTRLSVFQLTRQIALPGTQGWKSLFVISQLSCFPPLSSCVCSFFFFFYESYTQSRWKAMFSGSGILQLHKRAALKQTPVGWCI